MSFCHFGISLKFSQGGWALPPYIPYFNIISAENLHNGETHIYGA